METPEYFGTDGADVVNRNTVVPGTVWVRYHGKAGDDNITWSNGEVLGGQGNDTITRIASDQGHMYAQYWDAPGAVLIDLQAGYALDGWGGRDTLVNIQHTSGSGHNDQIYGSSGDDWINTDWGRDYVDGRGGFDVVSMDGKASDWQISASVDGRTVIVSRIGDSDRRYSELHNIEKLRFWGSGEELLVANLIDSSQKGPQTLVESPAVRWNVAMPIGAPVSITYSFTGTVPQYGNGGAGSGVQAWTETQKAAVRSLMSSISSYSQIDFIEVADTQGRYGQVRFGINEQATTEGYAFLPKPEFGDLAGDVWLNTATAANLSDGSRGKVVLLHELAHALGLKHPLDGSYTGSMTILVNEENDSRYTVMSSNDVMNGTPRIDLGVYDVSALRWLYGSRAVNTGNDTYSFTDDSGRLQKVIIDDGGYNVIDASAVSAGARIDLRPGKLSSIGRDREDAAVVDNIGIAFGTTISTVVATRLDDVIIGNSAGNVIFGLDGNDYIDGGAGLDTAIYAGRRADYAVNVSSYSGALTVSALNGVEGSDTLLNTERLQFADINVALDGSAAASYRLYQAAFVRKPDLAGLGYWIAQSDKGMTLQGAAWNFLASVEFQQKYGANLPDRDFISALYANSLGRAPDQAGYDYWLDLLGRGVVSRHAMLAEFSESVENQAKVIGSIQHGVEFQPFIA